MSMSSEHWKKIEGIVRRASDLKDESARAAYLSEACAGDEELRHTVERLLAQDEGAETLPKDTVFDEIGMEGFATLLQERDPLIGGRLGAYQITTELGYGGMGAVYLAERVDGAFKQRVAIKLVKRGMDTNFILRRFRQERQILAALNHPFIARLLDGGTTSDGLPYFVMEYIQGETLYRYSDEKKLSVAERLQLFRQVCEAVAYAHSNNVIHRDLKPSNVLIRSDGTPKLLDFGIAKVLNPEFAADTIDPTATHMRLMTPEYASPEQVRGEAAAPTSDVYSLGVLLYELLTGHRPYRLRSRAPHEIARVICEEEPPRPSEGLTYEDNLVPTGTGERLTLEQIYRARGSNSLQALRQQLVGDLERIVLKALRKDPAERYQSALAFADDITRYLEGKPVAAQSHNPAKLSPAGNRPSVVKTLAVLPLRLLNSDGVTDTGDKYLSIGLADAMITRLSGIHSLAVRPTSAVLRYGNDATDPFQAGRELAVDYALDGRIRIAGERIRVSLQLLDVASGTSVWASQFDEQFADVLELEDSISAKVADALLPLLSEDERRQLNKRRTSNAAAFEAYLRGRFHWNTFTEEGFAKAIRYFNQAISLAPDYALAYTGIADYYNFLGVYAVLPFAEASAKAKEAALKAVALDAKLAEAYAALGFATLMHDFDWDLASQHLRRAIELNPNYATGRLWYGSHLGLMGRFDEGFVQARQARELDPLTPIVHHTMNWMLYYARRYDESIAGTRRLIANEPQYGLARLFLCLVLFHTGQHTEALAAGERCIELLGRSPYTLVWVASAYAAAGKREQAYALLDEMERMKAVRYVSPYLLAMVYCNLGESEQAFAKLEEALTIRDARILWLGVDPQFDRLRNDPRLHSLLRRTSNPLAVRPVTAPEKSKSDHITSLAVLPFKLLSANRGDVSGDFLGIGLADALITRLSTVRRFVVRPTSSVLRFGEVADSVQAGRELGVDFVLEGSLRRLGDRLRVSIQLLNVSDEAAEWAVSFDEKNTDVLELEDSISERVAKVLIPHFTGEEQKQLSKRGTNNPQAYEAYLRGRYFWNQFTPDSLPKALTAFQTAVALDPTYALAHVGLADFYIWANIYGLLPSPEATPLAEAAALRAIELDDQLGEAYASLGLVYSNRGDWPECERIYKRALELNPNYVHAHEWYAALLVGLGEFAEGIEEINRTERLDPLSLRTKTLVAWTLYQTRRFDEALEKGREIIDLDKNYPQGHSQIGLNLLAMGRAEEAVPYLQKFDAMIPNSALAKYQLCFALVAAGRRAEAQAVLAEMKSLATQTYVKPFFLAMAHAALEERDEALAYFETVLAESEPWMLWLGTEPMLAPLRKDPRFIELLKKAKLPVIEQ